MELAYRELKRASLVCAAAVGHFTSRSALQLILCKQVLLEVWEVEENHQTLISSTVLATPIRFCSVIPGPTPDSHSTTSNLNSNTNDLTLDFLLIGPDQGNIHLFKWDTKTRKIKEIPALENFTGSTRYMAMMTKPRLSLPLLLLNDDCQSMESGTSLLAISSFVGLLQVVSVSWRVFPEKQHTASLFSEDIIDDQKKIVHEWRMYCLKMETEPSPLSGPFPSSTGSDVLSLSFLGSSVLRNGIKAQKAVDFKRRPLLAVLLAHRGLSQNMLSLECWAVDMDTKKLLRGPWKISNLHPTTTLVIPWIHQDDSPVDIEKVKGVHPKVGVLTISSTNISFYNASGQRSSLVLPLNGIPTCCDVCNDTMLIVADTSSSLYIIDLKDWYKFRIHNIRSSVQLTTAQVVKSISAKGAVSYQSPILFIKGDGGDAHLLCLASCSLDSWSEPMVFPKENIKVCGTEAPLMQEDLTAKKMLHDDILDNLAPVHDSVLVLDDDCSSNYQLLLACGNAPNALLCRMLHGFKLIIEEKHDLQTDDLPAIFPIYKSSKYLHRSWAVLSYRIQERSDLIEFTHSNISCISLGGFDAEHRTLAVGSLSAGWIVQVTTRAVRVFQDSGPLLHEWIPSFCETNINCVKPSEIIMMAALNESGIVLATSKMLYALTVDEKGVCHLARNTVQHHEVSCIGIFQARIFNALAVGRRNNQDDFPPDEMLTMVAVGHWMLNIVSILSWPYLNAMAKVECGSGGPIRSVAIANLNGLQYIFCGSSDGVLLYSMLTVLECASGEIDKEQGELGECMDTKSSVVEAAATKCYNDVNKDQRFSVIISDNVLLRIGGSEVSLQVGRFFGAESQIANNDIDVASDSVFANTCENSVLLFRFGKQIQAFSVLGAANGLISIARIHTDLFPFSLMAISEAGQLLISHLDSSLKLCWDKTQLNGTPSYLAYHKQSKCAIVCCQGPEVTQISFIQVKSMLQVLTVDIEERCFLTMLKTLDLPSYDKVNNHIECLVVGSYKDTGTLSFFRYESFSPAKKQVEFAVTLIARHHIDLMCLCHCIFHGSCVHALLADSRTSIDFMSKSSQETSKALFLALGGFGKVNLYHLSYDCRHDADRWMLDIKKVMDFESLGKSYVTSIATISENILLVVEEFYGVSIFRLEETGVMVPIALQLFDNPVQSVVPISEDVLLCAVHGEGLKLMHRNLSEEASFQVEKAKLEQAMQKSREQEFGQALAEAVGGQSKDNKLTMTTKLPCFLPSSTLTFPLSAFKLLPGKLGIRTYHRSLIQEDVVVVTLFGEIGILSLTLQ